MGRTKSKTVKILRMFIGGPIGMKIKSEQQLNGTTIAASHLGGEKSICLKMMHYVALSLQPSGSFLSDEDESRITSFLNLVLV